MITNQKSRGAGRHERVLRLLDAERKVLLEGPIGALKPLADKREALLADLLAGNREQPDGFLEALQSRAERNSRLLLASLAGLRAARAQVEAAEQARTSLKTYTAAGAAVEVRKPTATHDQRR
jgi:hypothetical protein